jgi:3-methyladenine DNA glycosylase AlkD
MESVLHQLRDDLARNADETARLSGQRFFKEEMKMYGMKASVVTAIAKKHYDRVKSKTKEEIFGLCEALWQSGYMEETFIACSWAYNKRKDFVPGDIRLFGQWISKYINNWASCDTFCNHTVGFLVEKNPVLLKDLKKWAHSPNRWMKRAAAVSLIVPGRKGLFLDDILEIADTLLTDPDDMVQKGYGWMLKVAANKHEQEVFKYVMKNKRAMPRTALRYAIEKMPVGLRQKAMEKGA